MSDGIRSGVNWMRLNVRSSACASVLTMSVLARPGTPISRAWPRQKIAMSSWSSTCSWPMMILPTSLRSRWWASRSFSSIWVSVASDMAVGLAGRTAGEAGQVESSSLYRRYAAGQANGA